MDRARYNQLARECYHRNKHKHIGKRVKYQKERKQKLKEKAVAYKGGKCEKCHQVFLPCVYDFHHKDPALKEYNPSAALDLKWEDAVKELDKCLMLCANCHRLEHYYRNHNNLTTEETNG